MSVHCAEEGTPLVCIHSVVVAKEYRHKGVASALLKEYHRRIRNAEESGRNVRPNSAGGGNSTFGGLTPSNGTSTPASSNSNSNLPSTSTNAITSFLNKSKDKNASKDISRGYEAFALLAHEELTGLYEKAGFKIQGHSHIQYGSGGWLEMRKDIIEKDSKLEELRKQELEEERRKDREEGKLKMEESKKEREREREEKRKASLLLNTNNLTNSRSNSFGTGGNGSANESDGNSDSQNQMLSPISMDSPNTSTSSSTSSPFPPGITQESILNALRSSSFSSSKGGSNPSQPYTQVLGATLAAKTPAEDSFAALEARLVNGQTGTNLAELYCPMENCGSILLKKGSSNWTLCESGPLLDPKLNLNLPEKNPRPPSGPNNSSTPIPKADSIDNSPRALSSVDNLSGAGPLRGFWSVNSPMSFENVGFSKDLEWIPPWVKDATSVENGGAGEGPSNQGTVPSMMSSSPDDNNNNGESSGGQKDSDGKPKREKPVRKGTWRERVRERSFTGILSSPESESGPSKNNSPSTKAKDKETTTNTQDQNQNQGDDGAYNEPPTLSLPSSKNRDPLIVKFITCGECDCGPLGFTFIPKRLANGGLANEVGKEIDKSNNGDNGGGRDRTVGQQELLVAADRVRYRFLNR